MVVFSWNLLVYVIISGKKKFNNKICWAVYLPSCSMRHRKQFSQSSLEKRTCTWWSSTTPAGLISIHDTLGHVRSHHFIASRRAREPTDGISEISMRTVHLDQILIRQLGTTNDYGFDKVRNTRHVSVKTRCTKVEDIIMIMHLYIWHF